MADHKTLFLFFWDMQLDHIFQPSLLFRVAMD